MVLSYSWEGILSVFWQACKLGQVAWVLTEVKLTDTELRFREVSFLVTPPQRHFRWIPASRWVLTYSSSPCSPHTAESCWLLRLPAAARVQGQDPGRENQLTTQLTSFAFFSWDLGTSAPPYLHAFTQTFYMLSVFPGGLGWERQSVLVHQKLDILAIFTSDMRKIFGSFSSFCVLILFLICEHWRDLLYWTYDFN